MHLQTNISRNPWQNFTTKTDHNQGHKKRTQMKKSKFSKYPINPVPDWYNPKSKRTQKQKTAFLCTFLEGAITDVFTTNGSPRPVGTVA